MSEAAYRGHRDIVDLMLHLGAYNYNEAMMAAAGGGHRDIIDFSDGQRFKMVDEVKS